MQVCCCHSICSRCGGSSANPTKYQQAHPGEQQENEQQQELQHELQQGKHTLGSSRKTSSSRSCSTNCSKRSSSGSKGSDSSVSGALLNTMWGAFFLSQVLRGVTYRQRIPYGVKQTEAYKKAKRQARAAARNARKMKESKGVLMEGRKCLMMSLQQNTGISWFRSVQVLKHLELHARANPPLTSKLREQITNAVEVVKQGR
ncbi:LOW QUALITY PROTEIN: uncharacterized protein EMH_0063520 [Eimeria mitis]|uniref:Uncharacterized protein n=1 Tax=Eimeria mitis TaxID=44415 RepID=U6KDU3_9EIME|nr:LOW QUALITY PROTEIN: uncharacterized protein EMH_0063520 [Eimeria mitis]CDJ36124.1 hypothetical protein, conserved [Eimeria mitis]